MGCEGRLRICGRRVPVHRRLRGAVAPPGQHAGMTTTDDPWLRELLSGYWLSDPGDTDRMAAARAAREPEVDRGGGVTRALLSALAAAWERGWQPADVVHAVRRGANARAARLAVALVTEDARLCDAVRRAPEAWGEQLRGLGARAPGG